MEQPYTRIGATHAHGGDTAVAVVVCNTCGAVVVSADRGPHDRFHEGLAELWESQVS